MNPWPGRILRALVALAAALFVFTLLCLGMAIYTAILGPSSWWPLAGMIPGSILAALVLFAVLPKDLA